MCEPNKLYYYYLLTVRIGGHTVEERGLGALHARLLEGHQCLGREARGREVRPHAAPVVEDLVGALWGPAGPAEAGNRTNSENHDKFTYTEKTIFPFLSD